MDLGQVGSELIANPLAQIVAAIASAATGWRIYKNQSSGDAVTRANDAANVNALATWKDLLEGERAARVIAEKRADDFADERNKAMEEVWAMKGQLKAMSDQLQAQTLQINQQTEKIAALQQQIAQLQERKDAST